jgi:adenine deaminase
MAVTDFEREHLVADVVAGTVRPARVVVRGGRIAAIEAPTGEVSPGVLVPGFVDAHVHVESSMLPPWEFARVAMRHGTVASVSDPHEIANVLGEPGIRFMLEDIEGSPFTCWFGCPSCVPATAFETAGARLDAEACARILDDPRIRSLGEVMDWPGAIAGDPQVLAKIAAAHARGKPVDGHAPGLRGADAAAYFARGISSDHECHALDEAVAKAALGVRILIREGSAALNFAALWSVLRTHPDQCMFCTDDAHPDDLLAGHVDRLIAHAVGRGIDPMVALRAATLNPVRHYGMPCGLLQVGDRADMVLVDDLESFRPRTTWIAGVPVAEDGRSLVPPRASRTPNAFIARTCVPEEFVVRAPAGSPDGARVTVHAIVATDGQIITGREDVPAIACCGAVEPDPAKDLLTIAVVNRYAPAPVAVAMVRGFGLRTGAIASSVAHDCHNVVAVGASPAALAEAVNAVFAARGGLSVVGGDGAPAEVLPLPIAGLMSDRPAEEVAAAYGRLTARARTLGSPLRAPYMTAGFMSLLVIPALKLGDRGLFDSERFAFVPAVSA